MTRSAEKTTVVDDRQIIKAVKINPKRRVCKITNNFQKAGVMLWQSTVLRRLWHRITCYTARCKPLTSTKNRKARLEFAKKHKGEPEEFWNYVYWQMRQKRAGKQKCGEKKGNCKWSQANSLIYKAWWRCCHGMGMHAVSGTGSLIFTDDLIYDDSSRMNLEGYKTILPTNIQENTTRFIGKCFILHQDNDPKYPASSVKEFIWAKKWKVFDFPSQSPCINPIEHEFHQLKRRVKAKTK